MSAASPCTCWHAISGMLNLIFLQNLMKEKYPGGAQENNIKQYFQWRMDKVMSGIMGFCRLVFVSKLLISLCLPAGLAPWGGGGEGWPGVPICHGDTHGLDSQVLRTGRNVAGKSPPSSLWKIGWYSLESCQNTRTLGIAKYLLGRIVLWKATETAGSSEVCSGGCNGGCRVACARECFLQHLGL